MKGKVDALCLATARRFFPQMSRSDLREKHNADAAWRLDYEEKRHRTMLRWKQSVTSDPSSSGSVAGVNEKLAELTPEKPLETAAMQSEHVAKLKPKGTFMIYTPASYKDTHDGRTYAADGHKLQ